LNITTTKHDDEAIWYGDVVEIELDTDSHSYYQIAVNPAGALVDLDRGADKSARFRWESQAEVATHVAADHWTVEIRIPVTRDENDPLNQVIGRKPSVSLPWHFNICRQRIRDNGSEHSAFSPTGTKTFHEPMKFAYFYDGRSHTFDVDETVTDYLVEASAAGKLMNSRKYDEALAAFVALSNREKSTDYQESYALAQAATCARHAKNFDRANELAGRIPVESVAKTAQMQNLAAQRKWTEIVAQFGEEDLKEWPFWQIGEGAFARGRGFYFTKNGDKAEADLQLALEYEPDTRMQVSIRAMMAHNRDANLGDEVGALTLYRRNYEGKQRIGGADEFRSVDRAATILTKQGKFEEALAAFGAVDFENQTGFWLHEMLISRGNALAAAGRNDEAAESFRRVTEDESALEAHRKRAAEALAANSRQQ
jgi:tetratricopeptide (TPR) repeat protein